MRNQEFSRCLILSFYSLFQDMHSTYFFKCSIQTNQSRIDKMDRERRNPLPLFHNIIDIDQDPTSKLLDIKDINMNDEQKTHSEKFKEFVKLNDNCIQTYIEKVNEVSPQMKDTITTTGAYKVAFHLNSMFGKLTRAGDAVSNKNKTAYRRYLKVLPVLDNNVMYHEKEKMFFIDKLKGDTFYGKNLRPTQLFKLQYELFLVRVKHQGFENGEYALRTLEGIHAFWKKNYNQWWEYWTGDHVISYIESLNDEYHKLYAQKLKTHFSVKRESINGKDMKYFKDLHLIKWGIENKEHRQHILQALTQLTKQNQTKNK